MMVSYRTPAITIMSLLVISSLAGVFASVPASANAAAPTGGPGANWTTANDNLDGTNYSPQTLLSSSNVNSLSMAWTVPMPNTDPSWSAAPGASWSVEPGADTPPLIVDGIAYFATNQGVVYALNAGDGAVVWSKAITLNYKAATNITSGQSVPIVETQIGNGLLTPCSNANGGSCNMNDTFACYGPPPCGSPVMHKHAIGYMTINVAGTARGIISVTGFACELWGFFADTGDVAFHITNICSNVPGDGNGAYPATYSSDPAEYYNSTGGGMLVYVMGGYTSMGGRSFMTAFNASAVVATGAKGYNGACAPNTGTYTVGTVEGTCKPDVAGQGQLWELYLQPPSTGDANWDTELCGGGVNGYVFDYPAYVSSGTMSVACQSVPTSVTGVDGGDWGVPKAITSGVSTSWGQYAIDNKTGMMYFGTGESGPFEYANLAVRPGMNLYSSSEMAVNLNTGKVVWWFQLLPHGLSDWDNSWSSIIGTTNGTQSIFKATKDGILFSLNALTGAPNWVFVNPAIKWAPGLTPLDPTNVTQMTEPWPGYPNATWIQAPALAGSLESDLAYDGQNIYGAWFNSSPNVETVNPSTQYASTTRTLPWPDNTTVTAVSANTGKVVWSDFFNGFVFRGGMTVTNGMLVMPEGNGTIDFLSTATGKQVGSIYIGAPLFVDPTIGQTANGNLILLQIIGGGRWQAVGDVGGGLTVPGAIMAFTLGGTPSGSGGSGTATTVTSAVAVASNLPLNDIAYGAVAFAIIITIANVVIAGRSRNKGK